jgi:hypothetical protein
MIGLLFTSLVSAKIFYASDSFCQSAGEGTVCNESTCPDGICPNGAICCGQTDQGVEVFPQSLPFSPVISKRYYSPILDYANPSIPDEVGVAHLNEILTGTSQEKWRDDRSIIQEDKYYAISNGREWQVCMPGEDSSIAPTDSAITVGESPPYPEEDFDTIGIDIIDNSNDLDDNPQDGTYTDTDGAATATIVPVQDNFFDGISVAGGFNYDYYYPVNSYSTRFSGRIGNPTDLCVQDGVCRVDCCGPGGLTNCTLDPDCFQSACNNATDGFCDYDCPRGEDPDCQVLESDAGEWAEFLPSTFVCTELEDDYQWAQCCPDTSSCYNASNDELSPYLPGEMLTTIKEFPCEAGNSNTNCGLLLGFSKEVPQNDADYQFVFYPDKPSTDMDGVQLAETISKVDLDDWSEYDYLEFYIGYFANFELNLTIYGMLPEYNRDYITTTEGTLDKKVELFGPEKVVNYAVQEPALRKWLHVKIPLGPENSDLRQAKIIALKFSASPDVLQELDTLVNYNNSGVRRLNQRNIVAFDKFVVTKENASENRICSDIIPRNTVNNAWISEDDLASSETDGAGKPIGLTTCQKLPGYGWTGTQCCGDVQDKNHTSGTYAEETYIDSEHACLSGTIVKNNTLVDIHIA